MPNKIMDQSDFPAVLGISLVLTILIICAIIAAISIRNGGGNNEGISANDDSEYGDDCTIGLQIAYDCQLVITDKDGDWTLEDAIIVCQNDDGPSQCLANCALGLRDNNCSEVESCFNRFCPNSEMTVCFKKTKATKTEPVITAPNKSL